MTKERGLKTDKKLRRGARRSYSQRTALHRHKSVRACVGTKPKSRSAKSLERHIMQSRASSCSMALLDWIGQDVLL